MNVDNIGQYIKDQGFKWCQIKDISSGNLIAAYGVNDETLTAAELKRKLETFGKRFPGVYSIDFKRHNTAQKTGICTVTAQFGTNSEVEKSLPVVNAEEIEKNIRERIAQEQKESDLEVRITELEEEKKKLDKPTEQLYYVLNQVVARFMSNMGGNQTALAGTQNNETMTKEETSNETAQLSDQEKVNEAAALLLQHFTPDELYTIATKLNENPGKVPFVKGLI